MIEDKATTHEAPKASHGDETFAWTGDDAPGDNGSGGATGTQDGAGAGSAGAAGREWLVQLQAMIENAATQATPVLREVAAKAAELAAVAGDKAGPVAARAAELTAEAGHRIAERSRDLAAELRRDQAHGPVRDDASAAPAGEGALPVEESQPAGEETPPA